MTFTAIQTERLFIRRFGEGDVEPFAAYRVAPYAKSEEEARPFLQGNMERAPGVPGQWFMFGVELRESGELVGDIALLVDEDEPRQAEIGYVLAGAHQGKGLAHEMVSAALDYAFEAFGLHRVLANVDVLNGASWRLLERLGFRREGHCLQSYWIGGKWIDEYLYAVLRDEWVGRKRK